MQTIVVDDNTAYAEALATNIGDGSEALLIRTNFSTMDEVETELKSRIGEVQDEENATSSRVLINRELKLDSRRCQEALGEKLCQRVTWEYPEVPFRLYSFRSQDTEARCTRLPFAVGDLPEPPDDEERLEEKGRACLAYMDEEFDKVQHGFEKVSPTLVNLVRLINGAIRAGKIEANGQVGKLLTLFGGLDLDDELEEVVCNFLDCAEQRARLTSQIGQASEQASTDSTGSPRQRQVVVVDDEVVGEGVLEGKSLWAAVLQILFERDGFRFSTCLPSKVQQNPRRLQDNDLVLMDIDFSQDANYDGASPEFGGRELLKEVHEVLPQLPVVMLSNYDEGGLYEECVNRGAYGYLTKDWGSYAKFRTDESEEAWFRRWQDAIEVPLNYRPFFQDARLLRTLGIASDSGIESLRTALKDAEAPTIETTKTLVTFFEEFVNGYLHYRGETPEQSLSGCLDNNVFRRSGPPVGQLLRILRNNVVHAPSFMNPEVDTWLYLLLLRAFMLRLLKPASLEDTAWMGVLTDKLASRLNESAALNREWVVSDSSFFEDSGGDISVTNEQFIRERNEKIDQLATRRTLGADDLKFHVDGLIACLAAIFPRQDLLGVGQALSKLGNLQDTDELVRLLSGMSKPNGRYKRGFGSMASIDWILNLPLRGALLDLRQEEGRGEQEYEGKLRWALAVRCWLWYFDLLLARPNSLMFESTLEDRKQRQQMDQASIYEMPDQKLVEIFCEREQLRYLPYYGLRIGLHKISKRTGEQQGEIERQLEDARSERKTVEIQLQELKAETEQKRQAKQQKQEQLRKTNGRLERMSTAATTQSEFNTLHQLEEKWEALEADLETINKDIEKLEEKEIPPLEQRLESLTDREDTLGVVLQSIKDEVSNPDIFPDQVEALERSIHRKMISLHDFLGVDSFDTSAWIENVHEADSCADLRKRTEELEAALS
jgi:CheY-like chemotaxis protein